MAQVSSDMDDEPLPDEPADADASLRSLLCDRAAIRDSFLRALVEEYAFQALSEGLSVRRPRYTGGVSDAHEGNDLLSLTFPRKLWRIVESDRFKSIWWDASGSSIVINEDLFKKEVLERKPPLNIFETQSMRSFVRQLNLYGFSKMGKDFQRSASLADFLAEEKEAAALNKLQFYRNPYFKRGCPQLLMRMKRRVGTKTASPTPASLVQDCNKQPSGSGMDAESRKDAKNQKDADNQRDAENQAESRRDTLASTSTDVHASHSKEPSTSTAIGNTVAPIGSRFSLPSLTLLSLSGPHAILNQQTPPYVRSPGSHTQANGHIVNLVTTPTSPPQYISPPHSSSFGPMAEPSTCPNAGLPDYSTNEAPPPPKLLVPGKKWILVPVKADTAASFPPWLTQEHSSIQHPHCD
ncbi:heat shock transcription factor, Y-linked-like [Echinops telfairi]|uniref:Heat shock transcription factor, Y-linked-like n=1 Tax=Echinops telfairi TaxID=9371 RepID=A0AC55D6C6_ECHTE|nr:heat shock transcription factor, Y-linked-like [Echinops telfairi]